MEIMNGYNIIIIANFMGAYSINKYIECGNIYIYINILYIILIYKLLNKNYKIDFNEYFTLNKRNDRFILPLMKTTKYQNTIFFKGIKYCNDIIFGNILKKNKITNINKLKKVMKLFFVNQYKI